MILLESDLNITKDDFQARIEKFKLAQETYIEDVNKGLDDNGIPIAGLPPQEDDLIKNIVLNNVQYEFKSIADVEAEETQKQAEEEAQKQAEEEAQQQQVEEAKQQAEENHQNKMDVNHSDYNHDYARTQEWYLVLGVENKTDGIIALRDFEYHNGTEATNELIKSVKEKYPKRD